jgi:hypothetical protein
MYAVLADLVLVAHVAFVLFVVSGGMLALKWRRAAWVHVPAAAWGVAIEVAGWICPLTPLEHRLRELAGEAPCRGDFIARYLLPVIYPEGLTREIQIALGLAALLVNAGIYGWVIRRRRSQRERSSPG